MYDARRNTSRAGPDPAGGRRLSIDDVSILVVCTANQCRSPLAAAFLAGHLVAAGVPARVTSAGTDAVPGPVPEAVLAAGQRRGVDLAGHLSRPVDPAELAASDLVLTAARLHVRAVVAQHPTVWPRCFTLRELVRRAEVGGARHRREPFGRWLARMHGSRRPVELLGSSPLDDVRDPIGGTQQDYDGTAGELDALTAALVRLAWPNLQVARGEPG